MKSSAGSKGNSRGDPRSALTRRDVLRGATLSAAALLAACARPTGLPPIPAATPTRPPATPYPTADTTARPLALAPLGDSRTLPPHLFGGSVEALIEHLLDNPAKVAALGRTAPGVVRFPGGSQANYYNWRTGLLNFNAQPNSSAYLKFWAAAAVKIAQAFPNGLRLEQYAPMAKQIGADVVLVPNLETSSVGEQAAWFAQLAAGGNLPTLIELGNEFYIAMAGDPASLRRWPDEPQSMLVMRNFANTLRPLVGQGAKFAVQSAASAFNLAAGATTAFQRRQLEWDAALKPDSWFEAVTAHLYPDPAALAASQPGATPAQLFDLFMGRADAGVDRVLNDIVSRVPDKEIWITEWSPRGGNPADINNPSFHELVPPPLCAQLVARYQFAFLRHPGVTRALYFTLNFTDASVFQEYVLAADGSYAPMAPAMVLAWFNDAANRGGTFQRWAEPQAQPRTGLGPFQESYAPIEGGLFQQGGRSVLLLQNASAEMRRYDPSQAGAKPWPSTAEALAGPLLDAGHVAATVTTLNPAQPLDLPPYSLARLVWG